MIKAALKIILLVLWIFFAALILWVIKKARKKRCAENFIQFSFSVICVIIGLRVKVEGELASVRPLLMVSNHISYLDIMILGAKTPAIFTPKSDMSGWPVISNICRLLNCIFIERSSDKIREAQVKIHETLANDGVVSLFPEGTTGNGRHVLPFKSSLFSIAEEKIAGKELFIQPAIISYKAIGSLPIDSTQWPMVAWYGDMFLAPHLWKLLQLGKIDAKLTLLPAVTLSQFGNRKLLAAHCHDAAVEVLQGR